jgi:hypothetical protein
MTFKRYLLLAGLGTGLALVLLVATANVVRTDGSAAINHEETEVLRRDVGRILPPIPIFPPL